MIDGAAGGDAAARREFAARYQPVVAAYLRARWKGSRALDDLDDALQDVFVECLKSGGVLDRALRDREQSFSAFLYAVVRNVARRFESGGSGRAARPTAEALQADALPLDEPSLTRVFDRAWAEALLREAAERQTELARRAGPASVRRVELLRELFHEGRTLADLARHWQVDEDALRHDYDRARKEFAGALADVVAFHNPGRPEVVARECRELAAYFAK